MFLPSPPASHAPRLLNVRANRHHQTAFDAAEAPKRTGAAAKEDCPLQLVSTGNAEDDYSFKLCEDNLDRVLSKVLDSGGGRGMDDIDGFMIVAVASAFVVGMALWWWVCIVAAVVVGAAVRLFFF